MFLLGALAITSGLVAGLVANPSKGSPLSLNSTLVFRGEVFVGCFLFIYILLAISIITVRTGRPPRRLGFGMLAFEGEAAKAVEALSDGAEVLDATFQRQNGLERRLEQTQTAMRKTARDLRDMAPDLPSDAAAAVRAVAMTLNIQLDDIREPTTDTAIDEALDTFHSSLKGLRRLVQSG